jgi:hypothetical protein
MDGPPPPLPDNLKKEKKVDKEEKKENVSFQDLIKKKNKVEKKKPKFIDQKIGSGDKKMRIVVISDTHNGHKSLELPEGDLLIHVK